MEKVVPIGFADKEAVAVGEAGVDKPATVVEGALVGSHDAVVLLFDAVALLFVQFIANH